MKKLLAGAVILAIVVGVGHSDEFPSEKSLRIRALGEHLAGVVSDDETDVLINPARLGYLTSNTFFSRIGEGGPVPYLPWVPPKPSRNSLYSYIAGGSLVAGGFFPKIGGSAISLGFLDEGFYSQNAEEMGGKARFYQDGTLHEYNNWQRYEYYSNGFYGKPFGSLTLFPFLKMGASYAYTMDLNGYEERYKGNSYLIDLSTSDTVNADCNASSFCSSDTSKTHAFGFGTAIELGSRTDFEIIGRYELTDRNIGSSSTHEAFGYYEYDYSRAYPDSDTVYHYEYRVRALEKLFTESDKKGPRKVGVGIRLSRVVIPSLKLCFVLYGDRSSSDISGEIGDAEILVDTSYSLKRHTHPETTFIYGDTTYNVFEQQGVIYGNTEMLTSLFLLGSEWKITKDLLIGMAFKLAYTDETIDRQEDWVEEIEAKLPRDSSYAFDTTYVSKQILTRRGISLYLPLSIEYILGRNWSLRLGFCPKFSHEDTKLTEDDKDYIPVYREVLWAEYSFGIGYRLSDRIGFDFYSKGNLAQLQAWEVEGRLNF